MPALILRRPELFDQAQVAEILNIAADRCGKPNRFVRQSIGYIAPALGIGWRRDHTRPAAKTLNRRDVDRIARFFGITVEWDAIAAA